MKRLIAALAVLFIPVIFCEDIFADIFRYQDENGVWHFTNLKRDKRYKLFIKTKSIAPAAYIHRYSPIIEQASERFNVESSLIKAIIKAESDFDEQATSHKGAQGLMQLMPDTSNDLEVEDPYDAEENIFGGTRYFGSLLQRYNNDMRLALAAYNAGPEKVKAYNGVPPFTETQNFIKKVLRYYDQYRSDNK